DGQRLPDLVVQLAGQPPPLLFVRGGQARRELAQPLAGAHVLADVAGDALDGDQVAVPVEDRRHAHLDVHGVPVFVVPANHAVAARPVRIGQIGEHALVDGNILDVDAAVVQPGVCVVLFGRVADDLRRGGADVLEAA